MVTFIKNPTDSAFTNTVAAFKTDSLEDDTLIVNKDTYLHSLSDIGADLGSLGAWTVNIFGSVHGGVAGIFLFPGNSDLSTITIGPDGEVTGGSFGIFSQTNIAITNSGVIDGAVFGIEFTVGGGTIKNKGLIKGNNQAIVGSSDTETIMNVVKQGKKKAVAGTIEGDVDLGSGDDTFSNYLKFKYTIKKKKSNGDVKKKKKTVEKSGDVDGKIDLGQGDDTFNGGNNAETVTDNNGSDTIMLRGGDDTYIATGAIGTDGNDTIDGGAGTDLYDASDSSDPVIVNLSDSDPGDASPFIPSGVVDASTARGDDVADGATDTITNFENAAGGSSHDIIFGSAGANVLLGNDGNDTLDGLGGNDILIGAGGRDNLVAGSGTDRLFGGADPDTFLFFDISDSGPKASERDVIEDFEVDGVGGELIDLSIIDANANTPANEAFTFIGNNVDFNGVAGELRTYHSGSGHIVEGDVDGDGKADFSFEVIDVPYSIVFSAVNNEDFVF